MTVYFDSHHDACGLLSLSHREGDARLSFVLDTDITQPFFTLTEQNRQYSTAQQLRLACSSSKTILPRTSAQQLRKISQKQEVGLSHFRKLHRKHTSSHLNEFWYPFIYSHTSVYITAWQITAII